MVSKTINTNYYKLCMTKLQNIFHVKIIRIVFFFALEDSKESLGGKYTRFFLGE